MKFNTLRKMDFEAELHNYEPPLTDDSVYTEVGTISIGFIEPGVGRPEIYTNVVLLPGARIYNLRDRRGNLVYPTDAEGTASAIFQVTGTSALIDPFNRVYGYTYKLTKIG